MRLTAALLLPLLLWPRGATAQSPRPPRVQVEHERGPLQESELRAKLTPRRFARCAGDAPDIAYLYVRVEVDGSLHIERGPIGDQVTPELRCVADVLTSTRFPSQTEPTYAHVTVFFQPSRPPIHGGRVSARPPGHRPRGARPPG